MMTKEYSHIAIALASGPILALAPFVLSHLYRSIHDLVCDQKPFLTLTLLEFLILVTLYNERFYVLVDSSPRSFDLGHLNVHASKAFFSILYPARKGVRTWQKARKDRIFLKGITALL